MNESGIAGKRKSGAWIPPLGFPPEATQWVQAILADPKRPVIVVLPLRDPEVLGQELVGPTTLLVCSLSLRPTIRSSCETLPYAKSEFQDLFKTLKARGLSQKGLWEILRPASTWYCWALFFLVIGETKKHVHWNRWRFFLGVTKSGRRLKNLDSQYRFLFNDWVAEIQDIENSLKKRAGKTPEALVGLDRWKSISYKGKKHLRGMLGAETMKGMVRRSVKHGPLLHMLPFWNLAIRAAVDDLRKRGFKGDEPFEIIGRAYHLFYPSFWPASVLTWKSNVKLADLADQDELKAALTAHIKRRYFAHAK